MLAHDVLRRVLIYLVLAHSKWRGKLASRAVAASLTLASHEPASSRSPHLFPGQAMAEGRGKKFSILKYFLMSSNAFGLMIGIFLVLFGMSYPEEDFPGGYKGRETAIIAAVFMFFTLIGYCGVSLVNNFSPPISNTPPGHTNKHLSDPIVKLLSAGSSSKNLRPHSLLHHHLCLHRRERDPLGSETRVPRP